MMGNDRDSARPRDIAATAWIADDVTLADTVSIGPGVAIYGPTRIAPDVRIDANATIAAPVLDDVAAGETTVIPDCVIGRGVIIGAGVVVLPGVEISAGAVIAPGALIKRNVPPLALVSGHPATITGYRNTPGLSAELTPLAESDTRTGSFNSGVGDVMVHHLPHVRDLRGDLSVGEFNDVLPFMPLRYFLVFDVPSESTRGEHAHKTCHQFLICTSGRCALIADDGVRRAEIVLDRPTLGVHIPPGVWGIQYKYTADAVLLVFASHPYDPHDYIRDYNEFLNWKQHQPA